MISLTEEIHFLVSQTLLEIRSDFKWSEFKELETPEEMADYLKRTGTKHLGSGSSRWVYLLSNRFVLKLANPENPDRGKAQNYAELAVATDSVSSPFVSQILDYGSDGNWLVSQLVRPLKNEEEFKSLSDGLDWRSFTYAVEFFLSDANGNFERAIDELELSASRAYSETHRKNLLTALSYITENEWVRGFLKMAKKYDLLAGDINYYKHWGKTADGRLVLLDYGYTEEVQELYY